MRKIAVIFLGIVMTMLTLVGCGSSEDKVAAVDVTEVKCYTSEANSELVRMEYSFTDENGEEYSGIVNGLRADKLSDVDMMAIAENLAGHCMAGSVATLSGNDAFQPVDAEKYGGKDNVDNSEKAPYGDANLCWAASTANMLVTGGWTDESEDEILSFFTENYYDEGAYHNTGLKFWFNGINNGQSVPEDEDENGCRDAVFTRGDQEDLFGSTQARDPGNDGNKTKNVGKMTGYAAESTFVVYDGNIYSRDEMAETIMEAVDQDKSIGLSLVFYREESRVGVHAMTINGYIKGADGELVGLLIADPDNDIDLKAQYKDSAEATLADRAARPNSYMMFPAEDFDHNEHDFLSLKDYRFSNSKLKYDTAVVQQITVLEAKKDAAMAIEHGGTKNAVDTPDILPRSAAASDQDVDVTVKAGEKVQIPFVLSNYSYKGYSSKDKPVVKCRLVINKDGRQLAAEPFDVKLVSDSYVTGEANCSFGLNCSYTFNKTGKYTADIEVLGVNSGKDGHRLAEAYSANNYLKNAMTITVK